MKSILNRSAVVAVLLLYAPGADAQFSINLNFTGAIQPTQSQRDAFDWAVDLWESRIIGYQPGVNLTGINITAQLRNIPDSDNGIGTVDLLGGGTAQNVNLRGGYWIPSAGFIEFDTDDIPELEGLEIFQYVVAHELAHALGFGQTWDLNGVRTGNRFTGENAIRAYQNEWVQPDGSTPLWVPLESEGGGGTAFRHWDEPFGGGAFTNIVLRNNPERDFTYELMTGWLNFIRYPPIVSQTTVASFADIGYRVVPEPNTLILSLCALAGVGVWRGRSLAGRRCAA
jgi:hypothetical protein